MNYPLAFLSGSPGWGELLVIFAVVLVLFGPRRLPELARMIGKALEELRRASHEFRNEVMRIDSDVKDVVRDAVYTTAPGTHGDDHWDVIDVDDDPVAADDDLDEVVTTESASGAETVREPAEESPVGPESDHPAAPTERKDDLAG